MPVLTTKARISLPAARWLRQGCTGAAGLAERLAGAQGPLVVTVPVGACVPWLKVIAVSPKTRRDEHGVARVLPPNPLIEWVGRTALKLMGWRIEGELPRLDKFVAIGAHHTSNWDFVIFIALKFVLRLNARWLRSWAGIPIQRHLSLNMVEQAIQGFRDNREFILVLSPEGTRKKVERWKMGFYHIALGAGVPVVLAALDYGHKRVVNGPPFWPTGDEQADLAQILAYYRVFIPKIPAYAIDSD